MLIIKTCKVASFLAVLVLTFVSLWAAVNPLPVAAASASALCLDDTVRTCVGISCQSQDASSGVTGYCACTRKDGTVEVKFCNDGPPIEENDY